MGVLRRLAAVCGVLRRLAVFRQTGHTKIRRHHGTHGTNGTDFIGCWQGEGGAINWCHV